MSSLLNRELDRRLECLPPFPKAATRALEELGRDNFDFARVERAVGSDPVLTARILRIANSPFFGLSRKIVAIKDACMLTGAPTLRNLIVASVAMHQFPSTQTTNTNRAVFLSHSVQCAAFAAELAGVARQPRDAAFTAGLLHDIGKLALDALFPGEYALILARGGGIEAETAVVGVTHAAIGARVAELWRLPPEIGAAIAAHHSPGAATQAMLTDVVHAADVLTHAMSEGAGATQAWSRTFDEVRARLALSADEADALYARGQALATAAAELFSSG